MKKLLEGCHFPKDSFSAFVTTDFESLSDLKDPDAKFMIPQPKTKKNAAAPAATPADESEEEDEVETRQVMSITELLNERVSSSHKTEEEVCKEAEEQMSKVQGTDDDEEVTAEAVIKSLSLFTALLDSRDLQSVVDNGIAVIDTKVKNLGMC
jgi:hypothetical protein